MDREQEKKSNPLIIKEKPYYTDEELELYYRIAIDESLKQGKPELAEHFQILLDYLLKKDKSAKDELFQMIMNHNKTKTEEQ